MKAVIFAVAPLLPSTGFAADALKVNARDHDCAAISKIIRDNKKEFVSTGFGGRSFRYPPARCNLGVCIRPLARAMRKSSSAYLNTPA
ncbi:hypothetical protein QO002_004655 [Pararhizobium capsulatum DSM 1112]|uniref:Uncharacterized protein n=1 Tax=Pararhizobium capsulatum DSM 1112 TaxID=1121113 RepID=A0ABU0BXN1_9HYPH|nr:hypothetical protein [Pararhizobium capsulatum DSM 1112]